MDFEFEPGLIVVVSIGSFALCCLGAGLVCVGARQAAAARAADGAAFRAAARGASVDEDKQEHDGEKKDADD
jgi:hypothetical protein